MQSTRRFLLNKAKHDATEPTELRSASFVGFVAWEFSESEQDSARQGQDAKGHALPSSGNGKRQMQNARRLLARCAAGEQERPLHKEKLEFNKRFRGVIKISKETLKMEFLT